VSGSNAANITQQNHTDLLHLSPDASRDSQFEPVQFATDHDHDYNQLRHLSLLVSNVLEYIAGWVIRKLSPHIACSECLCALTVTANDSTQTDSLLEIKNNGGLMKPSAGLMTIIKHTEKVMRESINIHKVAKQDKWGQKLETLVLQRLPSNIFPELCQHVTDTQYGIDSHYSDLVRNICHAYLKMRRFHVVNITNRKLKGHCVRQTLTTTILFKNQ